MLKRILIIVGILGLLLFYGVPYVPYTYNYEATEQEGFTNIMVEGRISHFAVCFLDVYTFVETDENDENVVTTTTIQFNNDATARIKTQTTGLNAEDPEYVEETDNVVHYKVINNKIYISEDKDNFTITEDSYSYHILNFYTIRERGETTDIISNIAVGATVLLAGMIVLGIIFFMIKKHDEK